MNQYLNYFRPYQTDSQRENRLTCVFMILLLLFPLSLTAQTETDLTASLAIHFDARSEVTVEGGRADLVTVTHAIEVEWANKWKESIGQSLWYAQQLKCKAGIILIVRNEKDLLHVKRLRSFLKYHKLRKRIQL